MPANTTDLEKRLWSAADELRANSKLKSSEYSVPVLGLIFLRFADHKFTLAERELAAHGHTGRRAIGKIDYQARGVLYLPDEARFSRLIALPEGADIGKAINDAMRAIEAENDDLRDVLPKTYNRLDNATLVTLLRTFNAIPLDVPGDPFGKIYEYFLGRFAMSEGQKGGEFFTPTSLVRLIVEVIRALPRPPARPRERRRRHVRAERRVRQAPPARPQHRNQHLRPGEGRRDRAPLPHEPGRPRPGRRHPPGQHLLRRRPQLRRQIRLRHGESALQRRSCGQGAAGGRPALPLRAARSRQRQLLCGSSSSTAA